MTLSARGSRAVRVEVDGATVAIHVAGPLDESTGADLVTATGAAVHGHPARIDIDLRAIDSHTVEGAAALVVCRTLGVTLSGGLHFRTAQGPGGDALLAAFADGVEEASA
jgi:hypothetical protein